MRQEKTDRYALYHGDCVEVLAQLPDASVDFSVYSPPFSSLFIYSDSERDMGNCDNDDEFFEQYSYAIREKYRVTRPGRLTAVHCSDLPRSKEAHGHIGLYDFPADVRAAHEAAGWTYASKITIWKDPVTEMQRTKSLGLLYKQLKKDSTRSRQGLPDYVLVFRKTPDDEADAVPVTKSEEDFPVSTWQQWASPVWMDINQTDVLNVRGARSQNDERHICPLQLDLIERAIRLWSNPGDIVLSPFMGIGSEGVVAMRTGRRFVGVELKDAYYAQAVGHISQQAAQPSLLDAAE